MVAAGRPLSLPILICPNSCVHCAMAVLARLQNGVAGRYCVSLVCSEF